MDCLLVIQSDGLLHSRHYLLAHWSPPHIFCIQKRKRVSVYCKAPHKFAVLSNVTEHHANNSVHCLTL